MSKQVDAGRKYDYDRGTVSYRKYHSLFRQWETLEDGEILTEKIWRGWVENVCTVAFVVGCVAAFVGVITGVISLGSQIDKHYAKQGCNNEQKNTGFDTEFINHSFWNYGCYVRLDDGKLIKLSQVKVDLAK